MDVNGTRFHLVLGDDWGRQKTEGGDWLRDVFAASHDGRDADFSWNKDRAEITLGRRVLAFTPSPGNSPADLAARRGGAVDVFGSIYWIAESGREIRVTSTGSGATTTFWPVASACAPNPGPVDLAGMAITAPQYLVVGTIDPAGILVFDLRHGGEPSRFLWPAGVGFAPYDFVAAADGGVWLLDREHLRVWRLDRTFGVVALAPLPNTAPADTFHDVDATASHPSTRGDPITLAMSLSIAAANPIAIEALPDDSILILDSPPGDSFSAIRRIRNDTEVARIDTDVVLLHVEEEKQDDFRLLGHDFVFVDGVLYVVGSDGDQAFALEVLFDGDSLTLKPSSEFFPMRLFGGKGLIGSSSGILYDSQDRWVPLVAQNRARYVHSAALIIHALDGKEPDCVWHRLMIDACIPPDCDVVVSTRAANEEALLDRMEWNEEPQFLRRVTGSELAWSNDMRGAGVSTWELLFQRAVGRRLDMRLEFRGTGRSTPSIRALRAWYPRFSYLDHYLPAVYREDAGSASFLDRFLANFEGFYTNIEDRIAAAQRLFDVACAPAEALDWLARWLGVALDPAWNEPKRRLFLRHAFDFFDWRGTVPGLTMALRLVIEDCADESIFTDIEADQNVRIVEGYRTRKPPHSVVAPPVETSAPVVRPQQQRWDVSLGALDLHERWTMATESDTPFPIVAPEHHDELAQWSAFARRTLGFVPRAQSADAVLWQKFLRRRYPSLAHLNRAWQTHYTSWEAIDLPSVVPVRGAALRDWVTFEGIVLPARDAAHHFTVFLPQGTLGLRDREKRVDLARRVIALEKPAHTTFDIKFYWAFFRLGEARLGKDTIVDLGSRSPELFSPFVLDRNYLGSGWLAPERTSRGGCQ